MISLMLARRLKEAGLVWRTAVHDFFAIPDRDLDDKVFVISDLMATMDLLKGWPVVVFHGTAEWALDYILTRETVWLPTEEQLRQELENLLPGEELIKLQLTSGSLGYRCEITHQGEQLRFEAVDASEAYGLALLHLLSNDQ